ncbi:MAG TPA: hypothetical protein VJV03_08060 [Pyrinomonadaceae bacterium]|nr:hypothetical protein [Pyrinomonadaceae bacterium]
MYCSSCGISVAEGLSYCNYCGAKLNLKEDSGRKLPDVKPELLVSAMAGTFILGLVAIIMMMGMMKQVMGLQVESVLVISLLPFLLLLFLEGMFIRLLFRGRGGTNATPGSLAKGQSTKELDAAHIRSLPEPLSSVTEHTTRAFHPIPTDRRSE